MAKTYKEKLLDVRWQKRRLEILEKDHWACRACETKSGTMHVHHLWYVDGNPWDAPDDALVTLCSKCHEHAPVINWKQAFLDMNLCESELLYIAIMLHWRRKKADELTKPVQEKFKTRFFRLSSHIDLFDDVDDLDEFFNGFYQQMKERYTNG